MVKILDVKRFSNGNAYYYLYVDNNGVPLPGVQPQMVYLPLYSYVRNNKKIYILYDNDGKSIYEFYKYINWTHYNCSENLRKSTIYALRYLYICSCIYSTPIDSELTSEFLSTVSAFIKGLVYENGRLITKSTVDRRISSIERYLECIGIKVHRFSSSSYLLPESRSKNSSSVSRFQRPPYISILEFNKLLEVMRNAPRKFFPDECLKTLEKMNAKSSDISKFLKQDMSIKTPEYDETAILIISLMFKYGLRIGEVLGLTKEDIKKRAYNGSYRYTLYIRNRLSDDQESQSAKNKKHPGKIEDYGRIEFTGNSGTSKVRITKEMYDCLIKYYNEYTMILIKTFSDNKLKADSIDGQVDNYYIFPNIHGDRMLQSNWNTILRKYFIKAGIPLDKGKKETNLNHKFRHSFAMMFVQVLNMTNRQNPNNPPLGIAELAMALRHSTSSGFQSCRRYFTWTEEREKEVMEELDAEFLKDCPDVAQLLNVKTKSNTTTKQENTENESESKKKNFKDRVNEILNGNY